VPRQAGSRLSPQTLGLSLKRAFAFALILSTFSVAFAETGSVPAAAKRFFPGINWKPASVVIGDFSCQGRIEQAVLGTTKTEIVVAVFVGSLARAPKLLRFSAASRDPATSTLTVEDGDFDPAQFEREVGYIPDGMRPSKTCKGLNLCDGNIDSAHIYWNHNAKQFVAWVL
jgi:hypothetical protein